MSSPKNKKEKVLHTRVSESLDQDLKTKAKHLGISVSNLVRNILVHSSDLVGDIMVDSANIGRAAKGETETMAKPMPAGVGSPVARIIGWQEITLNLNAICENCNGLLPKGSRVGLSVADRPAPKTILCEECLTEIQSGTSDT